MSLKGIRNPISLQSTTIQRPSLLSTASTYTFSKIIIKTGENWKRRRREKKPQWRKLWKYFGTSNTSTFFFLSSIPRTHFCHIPTQPHLSTKLHKSHQTSQLTQSNHLLRCVQRWWLNTKDFVLMYQLHLSTPPLFFRIGGERSEVSLTPPQVISHRTHVHSTGLFDRPPDGWGPEKIFLLLGLTYLCPILSGGKEVWLRWGTGRTQSMECASIKPGNNFIREALVMKKLSKPPFCYRSGSDYERMGLSCKWK